MTAKIGDRVKVHYTGTLVDGTEFDTSREREPLEFTLGDETMLPDFEAAVIGMVEGERKTITIPCEGAYGEQDASLNLDVPRDALPTDVDLSVGTVLKASGPDGQSASFRVVSIEEDQVAMDGNHPLAGLDLTFQLELVAIA